MVLHCTFILVDVELFPQVLFARHLYCPVLFLEMLMMFNHFPTVGTTSSSFVQVTVGGKIPADALQTSVTFLPSATLISLFICCTYTGTRKKM